MAIEEGDESLAHYFVVIDDEKPERSVGIGHRGTSMRVGHGDRNLRGGRAIRRDSASSQSHRS